MKFNIPSIWQENDSEPNSIAELTELSANTTAAALGLAAAFGVTNPVFGGTAAVLAFASPVKQVIERFTRKWNREITIQEIVAIAAPLAYLKSFDSCIKRNSILGKKIDQEQNEETKVDSRIKNLTLNEQLATNALRNFHRSELAQTFNQILSDQLIKQGLSETEVKIIVSWVAWETGRYLKEAVEETSRSTNLSAINIYKNASQEEDSSPYKSIECYLEEQIATLPKKKVFKEEFSFADIYIPLKATSVDANGNVSESVEPFILDGWAERILRDPKTAKQVIFIQAGAGRGKTVFCRMFADWVRQNFHPLLTPIFIRLRDIEHFQQSFENTLSNALSYCDFVKNDSGWLTDRNTQYLFLLDGFDELRMEGRASGGIERFIRQVGQFQEKFKGKETGHRIILTGRPLALQGISYLPDNLERVKLLPMNDDLRDQWLNKWQQVVIPNNPDEAREETAKFKAFLESDECPEEIEDKLAREPLLLYLLAKLHKEKEIRQEDFEQASDSTEAKILIYEKSLGWVLKEQRSESLQYQIIGLNIDSLERILTEAGLCVVQSGGEYAKVKMIETRLERDGSDAADIIKELREKKGEKALKTALGSFYIGPAAGEMGGGVEFYHKSFGEFLFAKRLQESLSTWTTLEKIGRQQQWFISKEQLAQQIYDILGYGGLTPEIVEYLMGLLKKSDEFPPVKLFERLSDFYWRWCDGEFIDDDKTMLPLKKMRELKEQLPERETYLGQRQIDVYAGLNIMILLLELHRYGQTQTDEIKQKLTFYPCGQPKDDGKLEDPTLLLRLIGYSDCIGHNGFTKTVGSFLSNANLISANLSKAYLSYANLSKAYLSEANLSNADLISANLSNADLIHANLSKAYLSEANLSNADLIHANLSNADLIHANLSKAYLSNADLSNADLSNADLISADLIHADLISADLISADLSNANLISADLSEAYLSNANLISADLSNANLIYADLIYADLSKANLIYADLIYADLSKANLIYADLSNANLSEAYLSNANLSNADLSKANLESAYLIEVQNLTSSQIKSAKNWEKAFYKGEYDTKKNKWIVNQEANQQYIKELKKDTNSDTY